jgi:Fur family ferric uptake transcriptional regulator
MILTPETITILVILCRMSWAEDAREELRRAGYRPGAAATAVLDHLASRDCCGGAQEIHETLTARGRRVGLASVYRILDALAAEGLVQRVDVGDGIVRFEPAREAHHHHLVCGECGKVEPFADPRLERAIEAVEERSGYSVSGHEVVLRGACADCRTA